MNDRIESDHMPVELYCKCQVNSDTANVEEEAVKRDKYYLACRQNRSVSRKSIISGI